MRRKHGYNLIRPIPWKEFPLNIQTEHLENHRVRLTVEVAPERVDKAMQAAARKIAQQVNIPGFRKGKAPYYIVIQKFGKRVVLDEADRKSTRLNSSHLGISYA